MVYYTLSENPAPATYLINKSEFVVRGARVTSVEAAKKFIDACHKEFWNATHNCSAYLLGERKQQQKADDDGEPSGTAGMPILNTINAHGLTDTVIVVTRYFGGIKLGASGLIRAYAHATDIFLKQNEIIACTPFQPVVTNFSYNYLGCIENILRRQNIRIADKQYGESVSFHLLVAPPLVSNLQNQLQELTSGTCQITVTPEITYIDIPVQKGSTNHA